MVAYVTKAGLVPSPSSHCCVGHSFGGRGSSYGTTPICTACTVYSFGGGVGIVLADSRRHKCYPAGPSRASLNLDKVFGDAKTLVAVFMIFIIIFFRNSPRKDDWVKKSSKSTEKQESRKIRHMQFSHIETSNWRLSGKWVKNDPICRKSQKKVRKVGRKVEFALRDRRRREGSRSLLQLVTGGRNSKSGKYPVTW